MLTSCLEGGGCSVDCNEQRDEETEQQLHDGQKKYKMNGEREKGEGKIEGAKDWNE